MRHRYHCPLRWADLDALGHVNNVRYVDYLQEARVDLLRLHGASSAGTGVAEGIVVARHDLTFRRPLLLRPEPVRVETWVQQVRAASFTVAYDIVDAPGEGAAGDEPVVYASATTLLSPFDFDTGRPRRITAEEKAVLAGLGDDRGSADGSAGAPAAPGGRRATAPVGAHEHACWVRWSDVDAYGHVNNVTYFEYFQEARIDLLSTFTSMTGETTVVVARQMIDYATPMFFRAEPYPVRTWVTQRGRSSFTLRSQILDGQAVVAAAETVLVGFDGEAQRSRPLTEDEIRALDALLA